jgi:hypothetical protein
VTFKGGPNDLYTEMIKRMRIMSPSGTNFVFVGDTEPTANVGPWLKNGTQWYVWDVNTKRYVPQDISASFTSAYWLGLSQPPNGTPALWLKTSKDATTSTSQDWGNAIRWFFWNGSAWLWPHDIPTGSGIRQMWTGTELDLWSYDGGDGTDPAGATSTTGAMWAVDTVFNLKSPRGALAGTLNPGALTGADSHTFTPESFLPSHYHQEALRMANAVVAGSTHDWGNGYVADAANLSSAAVTPVVGGTNTTTTNSQGSAGSPLDVVIPTIPASVGTYFIKRSARVFYTP